MTSRQGNRMPRGGRAGERGAGALGSLVGLVVGGGLVMVVISLFLTGLAQKQILPLARARMDRAVASAKARIAPKPKEPVSPDSSLASRTSPADSLEALLTQLETQRVAMEGQKTELERMRATIDTLLARYKGVQSDQTKRQAKLLAGMQPEEAARVLEAMDDVSVSTLVKQMNARMASQVLAKLDARRVARLSMAAMGELQPLGIMGPPAAPVTAEPNKAP